MSATRFSVLELQDMTPAQRRIAERRLASARRKVGAPLNVLIRSPGLAEHVERMSEYFQTQNSMPERIKQLVIALVSRHWAAEYPWSRHYEMARAAGISEEVLRDIAAGRTPTALQTDEQEVFDFCTSLLVQKQVSDAQFAALRSRYGEQGVADVIGVMGYYCMVCMALVVDRYPPVPSGAPVLTRSPGRTR